MKKTALFHSIIYTLFILGGLGSCSFEQKEDTGYERITSFEKISTLQTWAINNLYLTTSIKEPRILELKDSVNFDVEVYKITYKSELSGSNIEASGLICVPASKGIFPVISFQNGTNTLHSNAPSENLLSSNFMVLASMASTGFILIIPDYFGFGASEEVLHPYFHKRTSNQAVIDMLSASYEFMDIYAGEATYTEDLFLMGYSQGAWATLALLNEIENNTDLHFNVLAASCGGGAYNLLEVTEYILPLGSFPSPIYLPFFILSHQEYDSLEINMDLLFNEPYLSIIPELFDGSKSLNEVNDNLNDSVPQLLTRNFIQNFEAEEQFIPLRKELIENSVEAWQTNSQIHLYHGTADINVPFSESSNIFQDFQNIGLGDFVTFIPMENIDHNGGILPWGIETINWFSTFKDN